VALLAKAIISGSQELTVRLSEERSVRRAAEAVLDARIKTLEHQARRRASVAGAASGVLPPTPPSNNSPALTPTLTPAASAACLPPS